MNITRYISVSLILFLTACTGRDELIIAGSRAALLFYLCAIIVLLFVFDKITRKISEINFIKGILNSSATSTLLGIIGLCTVFPGGFFVVVSKKAVDQATYTGVLIMGMSLLLSAYFLKKYQLTNEQVMLTKSGKSLTIGLLFVACIFFIIKGVSLSF